MKTIVVATDLTARSDRALARGLALARELGATLHVVHVVDRGLPPELHAHTLDWAKGAITREIEACRPGAGAAAGCHVVAGKPRLDVVVQAQNLGADLIVLGLPDRGRHLRSVFAESTAGQILKASHLPVLLAHAPVEGPYRQVVIGVDFSVFSRAAVRLAHAVAPAAALHLVHGYVVPFRSRLGSPDYLQEMAYAERQAMDAFLAEEMALLDAHAQGLGIPAGAVTTELHEGPPFDVLTEACGRHAAELMVIGTHGRTGVSRAVWGSVAEALLELAPCDVLVARAG
jgi:nucleotide-binding universal stress UspA family protein